MTFTIYFIIIAVAVLTVLIWRSQKRAIPCPFWLRWLVEIENPFTKNNHSSTIVEQLDLSPGMTVLDVGCGPGRVTIPLAKAVGPRGQVIAVDIQSEMLTRVRKKATTNQLNNIRCLQANMSTDHLHLQNVDRAVLVNVLGEIPEQEIALREIYNVLKPGGLLCITEVILDPQFQRYESVVQQATAVGFRVKRLFGKKYAFTLCVERPPIK